jgi:hypothetical protein
VDGRSQAPVAVIKSEAGSWDDGQEVPVNISHDGEYATATALGCDDPSIKGIPVASSPEKDSSQSPVTVVKASDSTIHRRKIAMYLSKTNVLVKSLVKELRANGKFGSDEDDKRFVAIHEILPPIKAWRRPISIKGEKSDGTNFIFHTVGEGGDRLEIFYIPPTIEIEAGYRMIYDLYHRRFRERWRNEDGFLPLGVNFVFRVGALKDFTLIDGESGMGRARKIGEKKMKMPQRWPPHVDGLPGNVEGAFFVVDEDDVDENPEEGETPLQEAESDDNHEGQEEPVAGRP